MPLKKANINFQTIDNQLFLKNIKTATPTL